MKKIFLIYLLLAPTLTFACDDGFEAFQNSVYRQVRQDCIKCHDGSRPTAPPFAVPDAQASYNLLLNYMNFSKPEASLLVIRAGNGHCQTANCEEEAGRAMAENAKFWYQQGENKCFRNGKFFTEEIKLPQTLPTPVQGFVTLTFNLGDANPELKNVFFQLDIQDYQAASESTPGAYRVKSPRFVGGKDAIYFKDIKVLLNGKYDTIYNAFTIESKTVNFVTTGSKDFPTATGIVSGQTMIIAKDSLVGPAMSISFVEINPEKNTVCGARSDFESNVVPALKKMDCVSCHNSTSAQLGAKVFNLNRPMDQLCQTASDLTNKDHPMSSALITFPTRGLFGHPQLAENDRAHYAKVVKNWLKLSIEENQ